jgi:hypothetical protein
MKTEINRSAAKTFRRIAEKWDRRAASLLQFSRSARYSNCEEELARAATRFGMSLDQFYENANAASCLAAQTRAENHRFY